ncbi:HAD hydrolase-like protein [Aneurinibacillus aneurinilyticus]|uniref:HAD hydrolase-like protein n=1 Tax=Aneurinibacillus aneurinilyticus TaxID=1391 RepID=UPI0023F92347|nr:HAD hydrolase-like protein [Aneurinibacillus aneurinilyticus]MCI1696190.1 HAD hydrolase-like protein [Aneurinibacillus aneurinilyticus]
MYILYTSDHVIGMVCVLMIGDRLETDILLGLNSGIKTALVLTGVTSRDALENHPISPNYVFSTMGDLLLSAESEPASSKKV